jgi:uncharacterized repeat protein (TIGR03803 family)
MSQLTYRVVRSVAAVAFVAAALTPTYGAVERAGAQYRTLYSFKGGQDGALPAAALLADKTGALFGSTQSGGGKNFGTVFKLTPTGSGYAESVLHGFKGGKGDGAWLVANLFEDNTGTLYGTTLAGGLQSAAAGCTGNQAYQGCGVVFDLAPSGSRYVEHILYRFQGSSNGYDGYFPYGGLIADASGNLYGTTTFGGSSALLGSVFRLTPSGNNSYSESIVYAFPLQSNPPYYADGLGPTGSLMADGSGAFYGTSPTGGNCPYHFYACGIVYKLTPSASGYTESVLYSFRGATDGWWPLTGVIADTSGALYGTTEYGGPSDQGTVFKLTPSGSGYTESLLHAFSGKDGALPAGGLLLDKSGTLYGTTSSGGAANQGTVFKLTRSGSRYVHSTLYSFKGGTDGAQPSAGLITCTTGTLCGTTVVGGTSGVGTVFALKP